MIQLVVACSFKLCAAFNVVRVKSTVPMERPRLECWKCGRMLEL